MLFDLTKRLARTTLLLLSIVSISNLNAQKKEKTFTRFYLQGGIGPTTNSGAFADVSLQATTSTNFVATLSYNQVEMDPKNLPSDYEPGYTIFLILPVIDQMPVVTTSVVSLSAGKAFKTGRNTWFVPEAGLAYVSGEKMSFYRQEITSDIFSATSNYSTTTEKTSTVGGLIKADFNWAFASFMGLGAGVYGNLNSVQSFAGFQVKLMAGLMGREKKVRKE
ncbi:MAG TPA: hypothetical protein VLC28_13095 [Flavitalea sp.]|nr:hypothetical protein [Flavitalea sp.]